MGKTWGALILVLLAGCRPAAEDAPARLVSLSPVRSYPHDRQAYTQGLIYTNGQFIESTGLYGQSSLRRVELATGRILASQPLPNQFFGEGLALLDNRLIQLTWREKKGFIYDAATLQPCGSFAYPYEGWGLASDGRRLVASDGTAHLYALDPKTWQISSTVTVTDAGTPVAGLNELEFVRKRLLANIYGSGMIAIIDPGTGRVTGWLDLRALTRQMQAAGGEVLNGIAYDSEQDRLFVTGKLWPKVFELKLGPLP